MRILITGGAGYLGSVLTGTLLAAGHEVTVVDNFRHKVPSLLEYCSRRRFEAFNIDVCDGAPFTRVLSRADVVIPLAAIVGAPACDHDPVTATNVNQFAIERLCQYQTSDSQIIVFPNTNSGYGVGDDEPCTESTPLNPISHYGQTKVRAEASVLAHNNGVSLRFATLFGCSPRMRLDLLVNDFTYRAVHDRSLTLFEGGARRNYLHVRDAARAFLFALDNLDRMKGRAFNVGDSEANLTKRELCERIRECVPNFVWHEAKVGSDPDKRDYLVSNARIEALGWSRQHTLDDGIAELVTAFRALPLRGEQWRNC